MWETVDKYTETENLVDFVPINGAENGILLNVSRYFLTKISYNKLLEEPVGLRNNIRMCQAVFSYFDHL